MEKKEKLTVIENHVKVSTSKAKLFFERLGDMKQDRLLRLKEATKILKGGKYNLFES